MPILFKTIIYSILMLSLISCEKNSDAAENLEGNLKEGLIETLENVDNEDDSFLKALDKDKIPQEKWWEKWMKLINGENVVFRVIQFGDSHTAGDYFSHKIRQNLQNRFGNAGIGLIYPINLRGQRSALVKYQNDNWQEVSMRTNNDLKYFPLGGAVSRIIKSGGAITISEKSDNELKNILPQNIKMKVRSVLNAGALVITDADDNLVYEVLPTYGISNQNGSSKKWQTISFTAKLPITYKALYDSGESNFWEMGLIEVENKRAGITWSALGINGAQLSHWDYWGQEWGQELRDTRADLVVLAYGTNEAFNVNLNLKEYENKMREYITKVKQALPNAGILIIGAPESLKLNSGRDYSNSEDLCDARPALLNDIQNIQMRVAKSMPDVLYWSWQDSMGGRCSIPRLMQQGLMAKDGVHFKAELYEKTGHDLAVFLPILIKNHRRDITP